MSKELRVKDVLNKFARYKEHDEYHYNCDVTDGHVEFDQDKALAAINRIRLQDRVAELENALDSNVIARHIMLRINELQTQIKELESNGE